MAEQDGDGWARCDQGHLHWGRFGAVGLLACCGGPDGVRVLLARRSGWGQHGGTWGPPGGARDSDEDPVAAALREAAEECDLPPGGVRVQRHAARRSRRLVVPDLRRRGRRAVPGARGQPRDHRGPVGGRGEVTSLPLHPGFAEHWPGSSAALVPVTIIVDVANVMGSRPDGWWRDRAGAAQRLHGQLAALAERGMRRPAGRPGPAAADPLVPRLRAGRRGSRAGGGVRARPIDVRVVLAPGSGDDAIVAQARPVPGRRLVVTADRELRRRCEAAGAAVTGPGWLLSLL